MQGRQLWPFTARTSISISPSYSYKEDHETREQGGARNLFYPGGAGILVYVWPFPTGRGCWGLFYPGSPRVMCTSILSCTDAAKMIAFKKIDGEELNQTVPDTCKNTHSTIILQAIMSITQLS